MFPELSEDNLDNKIIDDIKSYFSTMQNCTMQ